MQLYTFILCYSKIVLAILEPPNYPERLHRFKNFLLSFEQFQMGPYNVILTYDDPETSTDLANWIGSRLEYPWILENLDTVVDPVPNHNTIKLHLVSTLGDFIKRIGNVNEFTNFNVRQKTLFLISGAFSYEQVVCSLKDIWNARMLNFMLVCFDKTLEVFSYNPFQLDKIVNLTRKPPRFDEKLLNLHGYKLVLSMYDEYPRLNYERGFFSGQDVWSMLTMVHLIRANTGIIRTDNGSWLGIINDLIRSKADFSLIDGFVAFLLKDYTEVLTYTYPYRINGFAVIVPKAGVMPQYLHIFLTFSLHVWILLIAAIFLVLFVVRVSERVWVKFKVPRTSLLELLSVIVNSPIKDLNANITISKRFLFIAYIFFSLIIGVCFQTSLTSALVSPHDYKDINTLAELEESKIQILISQWFAVMVPETSNLHEQFTDAQPSQILQGLVEGNQDYAYGITSKQVADYMVEYFTKIHGGVRLFHVVQEALIPSVRAHICLKKSPYLDRMNQLALIIEEHGLMSRLRTNTTAASFHLRNTETTLTVNHLQGAFYFLCVGYVFGSLCFFLEIFYKSRRIKRYTDTDGSA